MTINEVIGEVKQQMPNVVDEQTMINWLKRLDMQITDEIVDTHEKPDGYIRPDFEKYGMNTELIVEDIHAELYVTYLRMKIAHLQVEEERYQMECVNYNNAMITYRNYYNRKHLPLCKARPVYR